MTMYSILALSGNTAAIIAVAVLAVIALIAIVVGGTKGIGRIGWGTLAWGIGCGLFWLLDSRLHDKNPLLKIGAVQNLAPGVQDFVASLSWALLSVLVALLLCGLFAFIARKTQYASSSARGEGGKIGGGSRVWGMVVSLIEAMILIGGIAFILLSVFSVTPLREGVLQPVYENRLVERLWGLIHTYAIDFLFVGIVAGIAYCGWRGGFVGGFRSVFMVAGIIAALVVGFWLPFSNFAAEKEWLSVVGKFSGWVAERLPEGLGSVSATIGKVACGAVIAVALIVAVVIVGLLLGLIERGVRSVGALRFVDGILSVVVCVFLGALLCAVIAGGLYALEYFDVFEASALFGENSPLAGGLFDVFDQYLKPVLDGWRGA